MATQLIQRGGMLDSIIRLWWIVVGLAALLAVAAAAFSQSQPQVVPASGQIALSGIRPVELESAGASNSGRARVPDEASRVLSADVIEPAASELRISAGELRKSITARPREDGAIVLVDGRTPTAAESASRVNAVIAAYEASVRTSREARVVELTSALDQLIAAESARVAELDGQMQVIDAQLLEAARAENAAFAAGTLRNLQATSSERSSLALELNASRAQIRTWERRKTVLAADLQTFDAGIDFVRQANGASGPAEPNLERNVLLGLMLGLVIGAAVAWSLNSAAVESGRSRRRSRRSRSSRSSSFRTEASPDVSGQRATAEAIRVTPQPQTAQAPGTAQPQTAQRPGKAQAPGTAQTPSTAQTASTAQTPRTPTSPVNHSGGGLFGAPPVERPPSNLG